MANAVARWAVTGAETGRDCGWSPVEVAAGDGDRGTQQHDARDCSSLQPSGGRLFQRRVVVSGPTAALVVPGPESRGRRRGSDLLHPV